MRLSKPLLVSAAALALFSPAVAQEDVAQEQQGPGADPAESSRLSGLDSAFEEIESEQIEKAEGEGQRSDALVAAEGSAEAAEEEMGAIDRADPHQSFSDEERDRLAQIALRGRQLYALAQVGFLTTRDMFARIADPEAEGIVGWVAVPEGNAIAVTYYAEGEDRPAAVYRGNVLGGRVVSHDVFPQGERPPLNPLLARMAAARKAAGAVERDACGDAPFNVFVMPPDEPDAPIQVYHFTPQSEVGRYPLGGHYLTIVGEDGQIAETRSFAESCIVADLPDRPEGGQPAPIAVTHELGPMPTEAHVFSALVTRNPLVVTAGDPQRIWLVSEEGITEMHD